MTGIWTASIPLGTIFSAGIFLFIGWLQPVLKGNERIALPETVTFSFRVASREPPPPQPSRPTKPREEVKRKPPQRQKPQKTAMTRKATSRPVRSARVETHVRPDMSAALQGMGGLLQAGLPGSGGVNLQLDAGAQALMGEAYEMIQYKQRREAVRRASYSNSLRQLAARGGFGRLSEPEGIHTPAPAYPAEARKNQIEGVVHVKILVSVEGKVEDVEIVSAEPEGCFEDAIVSSVRQWQFRPAQDSDGNPVEFWKEFRYRFKLEGAR